MEKSPSLKISQANDAFRRTAEPKDIQITSTVLDLPDAEGLIDTIRTDNSFTIKTDPFHEHDMGCVEWYDEYVLWMIDYYDPTLSYGLDALDPDCRRILNIQLFQEYGSDPMKR